MKSKQKFLMSFLLLAVMSMLSVTTSASAIHVNHGDGPQPGTTLETEQKPHHVHIRVFTGGATVLSSDWIHFQVTFFGFGSLAEAQDFFDNNLVYQLFIDGNEVELVFSGVFIETGFGLGPSFDLNYLSHPLSVGEHLFEQVLFIDDQTFEIPIFITVEPRGQGK